MEGKERQETKQIMIVTNHPTQEDQFKRKPILNSCILLQHAQKKDEMKITRKKDLQIRALRSWRPREKGKHRQMSDPTGTQIARSLAR